MRIAYGCGRIVSSHTHSNDAHVMLTTYITRSIGTRVSFSSTSAWKLHSDGDDDELL